MTACDLSASAKPWDVQVKTVKVIFEEFYEQVRIILLLQYFQLLCGLVVSFPGC
jgi:hypothetical protein